MLVLLHHNISQGKVFACAAPALTIIAIGSAGLAAVELLLWKRR